MKNVGFPGGLTKGVMALVLVLAGPGTAPAAGAAAAGEGPASRAARPLSRTLPIPVVRGRLAAAQLGLVINSADPLSEQIGELYAQTRGLRPEQILRVELPRGTHLTPVEARALRERIDAAFGERIQALALAWRQPYAVECQSITAVLTLGYEPGLCRDTCRPSRPSPYFNAATTAPWRDLKLRPSMLLAAASLPAARALLERGVAADGAQWRVGAPPARAYFVSTADRLRNVRAALFPAPLRLKRPALEVRVGATAEIGVPENALLYLTGAAHVDGLEQVRWLPGALADHMTSTGGQLEGGSQMSALRWLEAGATASYGSVSEPCNHLQKFPHPQALLGHYLQGATAIEAYWKSVAWPQQGVFIGEPLAAPFARP